MGNTTAEIFRRMKERLTDPASTMEGSFSADNLLAVANELAEMYSTDYDRLMDRTHITTAHGSDLDDAALNNHGSTRVEATYEAVNLTITGTPGTVIDSSVGVKLDDDVFMVSGTYTIGVSGSVEVTAICTIAGAGHTVPAQTITNFLYNYNGLTGVINNEASSGGYDAESDEEFVARIQAREADLPGLYNIAWYRNTAKEINGVSKAKAFDCARGYGTVDVVIIAQDNKAASDVLLKRVYDHIEENRGIGANVLVESGTPVSVLIKATVYLDEGNSVSSISQSFQTAVTKYFENMDFTSTTVCNRVSFAKIMDILINCDGVLDIDHLTINGKEESLILNTREFAVMEVPDITAAE